MCSDLRHLRLSGERILPEYDKHDSFFTLVIHHKGVFVGSGAGKCYKGGIMDYFDYCNMDLMSMLEIKDMLEQLGYDDTADSYYQMGECSATWGGSEEIWVKLVTDIQLMYFLNTEYSQNKSSIAIYIESAVQTEPLQSQGDFTVPINVVEKTVDVEVDNDGNDSEDNSGSDTSSSLSHFSDSDYEEDDRLFDENIDIDAEWCGLREKCKEVVGDNLNEGGNCDRGNEESDGGNESDELNIDDSSDEEGGKHRKKWREFNKNTDMEKPVFSLGMLFPSADVLVEAIRNYAVKVGKQIKIKKKEKIKVRAICKEPCKWTLYASMLQDEKTLQIKTLIPEHTCNRSFVNRNVTAKYLAKIYVNKIRSNPKWPIESFQEHVMADLKVTVSRAKLYRAKSFALNMINGNLKEQYNRLHDYVAELKRSNPDSTVVLHGDGLDYNRFFRIYICLGALKKGMRENCRPLVGLDGCHLNGCTGGILLAAIGIDGNNSMYPIAYAVVESENKSSWKWFIELLKGDIGIVNTHGWTFMTDKQKGLLPAIDELCENSKHRTCVRHLYNNFKLKYKGLALKDALYAAARATTVPAFNHEMEELEKLDSDAFSWLTEKPPSKWTKSHFMTFTKSDMLLNNLCESFNSMILDARDKPILSMLEKIRCILMKRIHVNRKKMMKYEGVLCPKIQQILEKTKEEASYCVPDWSGDAKFEVEGPSGKFVCNLDKMTCHCRKWDLTGIPCMHGISAMTYAGLEPEGFVHKCYHKENYMQCYTNYIQPLNGPQLWHPTGKPPVSPPLYAIQRGQKQHKRRLEPDERAKEAKRKGKSEAQPEGQSHKLGKRNQVSLKCGNCGKVGHNKRSCKQAGKLNAGSGPNEVNASPKVAKQVKINAVRGANSSGLAIKRQKLPINKSTGAFTNNPSQVTTNHSTVIQSQLSQTNHGQSSQPQPTTILSRGQKLLFSSQDASSGGSRKA